MYQYTSLHTFLFPNNAVVMLGFTEEVVTVSESEGEAKLFVSISHIIARPLNFIIIHNSITTGIASYRGTCAVRVTVLGLCACVFLSVSCKLASRTVPRQTRNTNGFSVT